MWKESISAPMSPLPSFGSIMEVYQPEFLVETSRRSTPIPTHVNSTEESSSDIPMADNCRTPPPAVHVMLEEETVGSNMIEEETRSQLGDAEEGESVLDPQVHDTGPIDDSDDKSPAEKSKSGTFLFSPTLQEVKEALDDIADILKPPWRNKRRAYKDPGLDKRSIKRLEEMAVFCRQFIKLSKENEKLSKENKPIQQGIWSAASLTTSQILGHSRKGS